jgi:hypothetical protein
VLVAVVGIVVAAVAITGLAGQAVRGNRTVSVQQSVTTARNAALDDAFYHCIDVQTRSLVSPGQPVVIATSNLADFITLLKGVGSWITVADPPNRAVAQLSLRNDVQGRAACRGTVVVAHYRQPPDGVAVRIGSGATAPGQGPPPAPPL